MGIRNCVCLNLFVNSNNNSTHSDNKSNSNANVSNVPLKSLQGNGLLGTIVAAATAKKGICIDSVLASLKSKMTTSMLSPSRLGYVCRIRACFVCIHFGSLWAHVCSFRWRLCVSKNCFKTNYSIPFSKIVLLIYL